MTVKPELWKGRRTWVLDNGKLSLRVMAGGGHLAELIHEGRPDVNPYWVPPWRWMEPWEYGPRRDAERYGGSRLLASIAGHNICLGVFGPGSDDEIRAGGAECHGDAPTTRWRPVRKRVTRQRVRFTCACNLPNERMRVERTLTMRAGSDVVRVRERFWNLAKKDVPYTMCEHVTFGPPFLEKGVTLFDMSAEAGHTFPEPFGEVQRFRTDTPFEWPRGPGRHGRPVDMRTIGSRVKASSDFTSQLMDRSQPHAWFSAVNPRQGLLVTYVWNRTDFPWLGNWEENRGRGTAPWNNRTLTRGMEFANSPFPLSLRDQVDLGTFQGERTYRWLPARASTEVRYAIVVRAVEESCRGVADVAPAGSGFRIQLL